MPSASLTKIFDDLVTSTLEYKRKKYTMQAFTIVPILEFMKAKGRVEEVSGSSWIEVPVLYGKNETIKWISAGDTISITDKNVTTMAIADWRKVALSVVRLGESDRKNRGQYQALNYVTAKLDAANATLATELEEILFLGDDTGGKPYGLGTLISSTPASGVVMGINRSTVGNEYWRNQQATVGAYGTLLLPAMSAMKRSVLTYTGARWSDYGIFTNSTVYGYYETLASTKQVIYDTKVADMGFGGLKYDGVTMYWSPSCPDEYMYFLNSQDLRLYIDPQEWLKMTEWKLIPDQIDDRVAQLKAVLQLCIHRACNHGVLTGITA